MAYKIILDSPSHRFSLSQKLGYDQTVTRMEVEYGH